MYLKGTGWYKAFNTRCDVTLAQLKGLKDGLPQQCRPGPQVIFARDEKCLARTFCVVGERQPVVLRRFILKSDEGISM